MGRESKREKTWSDCFMANASVKKRSPRSPCRRKESREPERPVFGGEHVCAVLQKLFEKSSTKPEVRAPSISPRYRRSNREEVCSSAFEKKRKRQKPRRTKNYITTTRHPSDCSSIARTYGACCRNYAEQVCQSSTQPRTSICCCPEMFCRHQFTTTCDVISSSTTELSQCKTRYNQAPSTAYGSICTPQYTCHRNLCETDDSCVVPCSTYIASYLPPVCQNLLDDICPRRGTCPVSRVDSVEKDLCRMPYMPQTLTEEIGNYAYSHKLSPRNASCSLSSRIKPLRRESPSCSRPCTSKKALSSKCTSPIATIPSPFKDCTLSETTIKILECRSDKPRTSVEQKSSKRPITKVEKQTQACQTDELTINNLSPSSDTPRRSVTITNPNVIDDTTYVRPDNDQNEIYNIIPYVVPPPERRSSGYSGSPTDIPRTVLERSEVMVEDALSQESVKKGATSTVIKMESIREQMAKTDDILRLHAKPGYRRTSESSVSRSPRSSLSQPAFKARPGETALPLEPQPPSGFDYKSKAQSNVSQSPCSSLPKPEVENRRKSQCSAPRSTRSSLSQIKVPPNRESQSSAVRSPRGSISQPKIESRREPQTSARQPCMAAPQPDVEHRRSSQSQSDVPRSQRASSLQQKFPDTMHEMCAGISDPDTGSDDMPGFSHHKTHSFEVMFSTSQVRDERVSKSDLDLSTRGTLQDNDMRSSKSKKRSSTSIPDEGKRTSSILTPNADDDAFLSGAQFAYIKEIDSEIQEFIKYLQNRLKNCDETVRTQLKKLEEDQKIVEGDPSYCEKVCGAAAAAHIRMIDEEDVSPSNSRSGKGEVGECGPEKGIDFEIPELDLHLDSPGRSSDRNTTPCDCGCAYGPYFRRTVSQRSISRRSEIPPFTGCECMREDYYKIMRLAYG